LKTSATSDLRSRCSCFVALTCSQYNTGSASPQAPIYIYIYIYMHEYTHTHRNICKCMHAYIHTKPRRRAEESGHTRADGGAKCAGGNTRSPFRHPICIHTGIYHTAGGGWGPGHGGTAQPIACAPSALARAQAPEPLVRVPQRRAHRARRAAPAHGGAPRAAGAGRSGTAAAAGARATRRRGAQARSSSEYRTIIRH
jgi:hypothetical protein